jgi:hypothetical protein
MDEIEYKEKLENIRRDYDIKVIALKREFALSNAKYKSGQIIKSVNRNFIIEIDTVSYYTTLNDKILTKYKGRVLKKDLTPKKGENIGEIFGDDKIELLN